MEEAPICVRGEPCSRGYGVLANEPNAAKPDSPLEGEWFNTGNLGYFDADRYLYITSRSKEVNNRSGKIIAPMEVEEAALSHSSVRACAAFLAAHDILQETIGIAIVPEPNQPRRLDLPTLQAHVAEGIPVDVAPSVESPKVRCDGVFIVFCFQNLKA
jgi:acyl-CoA synthetase (AMP-forming)/AMP-acid ligase II